MNAQPARGYQFEGWTGACTGDQNTCTVAKEVTANVGAVFVPAQRRAPVAFKLRPPKLTARWVRSNGKGTLLLRGSVGQQSRLRFELRRPGGGPLVFRRLKLKPGPFRLRQVLQKGKLLRGATLLPGGFVVVLRGTVGNAGLPLQIRTLAARAPREGVVRQAFVSTTRNGQSVRQIPAGSAQAWATFRFAAQPTSAPLVARWYRPNGQLLGTSEKSNRPLIKTGIGGSSDPVRRWRCDLVAGNKIVRRLNVRVG